MAIPLKIETKLLRTARLAWSASSLVAGCIMVSGAVSGYVVVLVFLDNLVILPSSIRWVCLGLGAVLAIAAAWRWLLASAPAFAGAERVAAYFERRVPDADNALINSVQLALGKERGAAVSENGMAALYLAEASRLLERFSGWEAFDKERVISSAKRGLGPVLALVLYVALLPSPFQGGLYRVFHPASTVSAGFGLRIEVTPGDATVVEGADLEVRAGIAGGEIEQVVIEYEEPNGPSPIRAAMYPTQEGYVGQMRSIAAPRTYRVIATPAKHPAARLSLRSLVRRPSVSETYRVDTVVPPKLERIKVAYRFPDYTGRQPTVEDPATGDIKAPVGAEVTLHGECSKPLARAALQFGDEQVPAQARGQEFDLVLTIEKSASYQFRLEDEDGFANVDAVFHTITAVPDAAPQVTLTAPPADVTVTPADTIPLVFDAQDDYGLTDVAVCVKRGDQGEVKTARSFPTSDFASATRFDKASDVALADMGLAAGEVLQIWVQATDNRPGETNLGRSRTLNVRIATDKLSPEEAKLAQDLIVRLEALAERQRALNKDLTRPLEKAIGPGEMLSVHLERLTDAVAQQADIRTEAIAIAEAAGTASILLSQVNRALGALAANDMPRVIEGLRVLAQNSANGRAETASLVLKGQTIILAKLEDLVRRLRGQTTSSETSQQIEEPSRKAADAQDVKKKLEEPLQHYADAQRHVIEQTSNLSPKPVADLTADEKDAFKNLSVAQDDLSKFLEELISDLSKLPVQDFSAPSLRDELVEILAEVELAEDALKMENKTIAVTAEQTGLELAEQLIHDLPRWLLDVPDKLKWEMEEPPENYEVPMADLPSELYDMIGDLIDQEAAMTQEVEDQSSSWADSIDAGAGWAAMDGPISNMSAKGITGNLLPNSSEIGGRSGEGRSGRAGGEFVEKTASGKGGRPTPTRITPDPFEQGVVQDSSTDPVGGATGGGKLSGAGGYGLPGQAPPEVRHSMERLAGRQADLRVKAERLRFKLQVVNIPAPDLDEAIHVMRAVEDDLKNYRYQNVLPKREILLNSLRESRQSVQKQITIRGEPKVYLPKETQLQIIEALDEQVVPEYRDLVAEYFKTLAESKR